MSSRRATPDAALPEELRTDASIRNYSAPSPKGLPPPPHRRAVEVRGSTTAMRRLTRSASAPAVKLLVPIALLVAIVLLVVSFVSDVDSATRSLVALVGVILILLAAPSLVASIRARRYDGQGHRRLAAIQRLAARSGPAKSDRSGSEKSDRSGSAKSDRSGSAKTGRSGSARIARKNERDAKQRAAAVASGQALPVQLQRRGRRQSVSGLRPLSGDEDE
jgi:hypothetical protein